MKIKYFSWLQDITCCEYEEINNQNIIDIRSLEKFICHKYPKLKKYILEDKIIRIAINLEYVFENTKIHEQDEIALFPPVSGG